MQAKEKKEKSISGQFFGVSMVSLVSGAVWCRLDRLATARMCTVRVSFRGWGGLGPAERESDTALSAVFHLGVSLWLRPWAQISSGTKGKAIKIQTSGESHEIVMTGEGSHKSDVTLMCLLLSV